MARNVAYNRRTEVQIVLIGHQKDGFRPFVQLLVGERHLKFVLKIRHRAQSLDNRAGALFRDIVRQQTVEGVNLDVRQMLCHAPQEICLFLHRKSGFFGAVHHRRDNQLVKQRRCALDNIQMSQGRRIKAARIHANSHVVVPFVPPASPDYSYSSACTSDVRRIVPYLYCFRMAKESGQAILSCTALSHTIIPSERRMSNNSMDFSA